MSANLYKSLKTTLFHRWVGRVQGIIEGARRIEASGMDPCDAYAEGYRTAYFDAVSDLLEAGCLQNPATTETSLPMPESSEVH